MYENDINPLFTSKSQSRYIPSQFVYLISEITEHMVRLHRGKHLFHEVRRDLQSILAGDDMKWDIELVEFRLASSDVKF